MRKLDRHFGYYQCSLCGKKKGALYGETGTIGSNCSNVLRHTAGESHGSGSGQRAQPLEGPV